MRRRTNQHLSDAKPSLFEQCISDLAQARETVEKAAPNHSNTILKKIYYVLHRGGLYYRCRNDGWRAWEAFGMPLASALCHAGRVLIQVPRETKDNHLILSRFRKWVTDTDQDIDQLSNLPYDQGFGSRVATHGVEKLSGYQAEHVRENECCRPTKKRLKEIKITDLWGHLTNIGYHKGINLAWGGSGNVHSRSHQISVNGENGHLYFYSWKGGTNTTPGAFLIGMEPSAPGCSSAQMPDEAKHDYQATSAVHGINGGDKFSDPSGQGVFQPVGPSKYYDSLCVLLDIQAINQIMNDFPSAGVDFLASGFNPAFENPTQEVLFDFIKQERSEISAIIFPELLERCDEDLVSAKKNFIFAKNWTLLHFAVYYDRPELIEALVNFGLDVEAKDNYGRTPLMLCLAYSEQLKHSAAILRKLLEKGADPNATSDTWYELRLFSCCSGWANWTPLDIAVYKKESAMIDLLKNQGACSNKRANLGY